MEANRLYRVQTIRNLPNRTKVTDSVGVPGSNLRESLSGHHNHVQKRVRPLTSPPLHRQPRDRPSATLRPRCSFTKVNHLVRGWRMTTKRFATCPTLG